MRQILHFLSLTCFAVAALGQGKLEINLNTKYQIIDGFGAFQGGAITTQSWWQNLYIDELNCSIYRVDLTPRLKAPYSDLNYYSPWFMGSQTKSVFNFEDPPNPNGPEGNRVRTYTSPADYSRTFGSRNAPIAVMGPDIEKNVEYFTYPVDSAISQLYQHKKKLGDVKIIGSIWSPLPWLKVSSGNTYNQNWWPGPVAGSKWPFVWGGNFAGGRLDVSGTKYQQFNDANIGGTGNTDAITQFARSSAAYILGYQRNFKFKFYSISIQNELNFEEYYNSMTYPLSSQYITALKALRAEFDKYPELKDIRIMGPEDLLGGDAYGLWEYGGPTHKNLQYLSNIIKDSQALKALDFVCIHGYANDGVSSAGANSNLWSWWLNGWTASPAAGLPSNVKGFASLGKKSWMTETSGEKSDWLFPKNSYPNNGAWSIALKIHQALTIGMQSAWLYWTFVDSNDDGTVSDYGLTNQQFGASSPKFNAVKHYYKFIRPGMVRIDNKVAGNANILSSAYLDQDSSSLCCVLLNTSSSRQQIELNLPSGYRSDNMTEYTSSDGNYFLNKTLDLTNGKVLLDFPAYSVKTITGTIQKITNTYSVDELIINAWFNKANQSVILECKDGCLATTTVHIYALQGNNIPFQKIQSSGSYLEISTVGWENGLYILEMIQGKNIYSKKIIVSKD